jgi:glucose-6-phosphate 1-dehydrogenase
MPETKLHLPPVLAPSRRVPETLAPCALVLFGATGDLARRKLIPALYNLSRANALPAGFAIVGVSRSAHTADALRAEHAQALAKFSPRTYDERAWQRFAERIELVPGDLKDASTYSRIREELTVLDRERGTAGNRIFYLSTPASAFPDLLKNLSASGLLGDRGATPWARIVIEKPFGHDLRSARALNAQIAAALDEKQVFRIDHYLGKETIQNILVFRFGNAIFEPVWKRTCIDHVQITAAESIGIEGRGSFYDETGVVRDMFQNHLLQALACCAIESPISFGADDVRDQKVQLIRSLHPIENEAVAHNVVLGQYRGYREEPGVDHASRTPTFAAVRLFVDNWRWQGVPFYLRSGKRLAGRMTEIAIHFRPVPYCLFGHEEACLLEPNILTLRIQPDEGIALRFAAKVPGEEVRSIPVTMDMTYAQAFVKPVQEAYETLLRAIMRGDQGLFWRRDEVEHSWSFVTPILERMEQDKAFPIEVYDPGSQGPRAADELLARDGRRWTRL